MNAPRKPKLLFFVTEDWYFCSHRLPLAIAAREAGYEVVLATRVQAHRSIIEAAGIRLLPLDLSRGAKNPLKDWRTLLKLYGILRSERPDILHNVAMKPVLYGSLAAKFGSKASVINALAGLGHLFAVNGRSGHLRRLVHVALKALLLRSGRVIVQNPDDLRLLVESGTIEQNQALLIRGSGADLDRFKSTPEPLGPPVVVMAARLLWDKGVGEFVAAAEKLKREGLKARFILVGEPDTENHSSIQKEQIEIWVQEGAIEWWGQQSDMPWVFSQCHIVCLPSYYGEGVPKVLLEAAAAQRPIITTDMPGCREAVEHEENGLLVTARDVGHLAEALRRLIEDRPLRERLAQRGRQRAEQEFGIEKVVSATLELYSECLGAPPLKPK
ncbi:MAG: glycosyltransferase family 1 protein [Gammaproteobacteria bacterium]|nr:glycosyltransferase family 1 protein [Gammaproteobacteria bacterium]NBT43970.1 glycosyltransferase family 1 protein [Gammaproteobacteria bacterium]NBY22917.1 glycosyltransferase family 1 protein [Gammaproteobacteria bacterium]